MGEDAYRCWEEIYPKLSEDRPGLLGAIARAEAQTIRLALLYALLDRSPEIARGHLEAALALWRYCDASAHYIFGDLVGEPVADTILRALRNVQPNGMSRSDISGLFRNHLSAGKMDAALVRLLAAKKVRFERHQPPIGRPREMWFIV
jgi:hypothetical protein